MDDLPIPCDVALIAVTRTKDDMIAWALQRIDDPDMTDAASITNHAIARRTLGASSTWVRRFLRASPLPNEDQARLARIIGQMPVLSDDFPA